MKKNIGKAVLNVAISSALLFCLFGCGGGYFYDSKHRAKTVGASDLPSSGANTFVTTQAGASVVFKNFASELPDDSYFVGLKNSGPAVLTDFQSLNSGKYGDKEYFVNLRSSLENIFSLLIKRGENTNETVYLTPGNAKISSAGYEANVPSIYFSMNGFDKDISAKMNGSAFFKTPLLALDLNTFSFNMNSSSNSVRSDLHGDFDISVKTRTPGLILDIPSFKIELNQMSVNEKNSILQDSSDMKISGSSFMELNPKEVTSNSMIKKAMFAVAFEVLPTGDKGLMDSTDFYYSEGSFDFNAGLSFVLKNGTGGKIIACGNVQQGKSKKKAAPKLSAQGIFEAFKGNKYSKEQFDKLGIPLQIYLNVSFYDDDNIKTLDYVTIKNLYDLYGFIYDTLEASGAKGSFASYFQILMEKKQNLSTRNLYDNISSSLFSESENDAQISEDDQASIGTFKDGIFVEW